MWGLSPIKLASYRVESLHKEGHKKVNFLWYGENLRTTITKKLMRTNGLELSKRLVYIDLDSLILFQMG